MKPRIRFVPAWPHSILRNYAWHCYGNCVHAYGYTPQEAYAKWKLLMRWSK